MNNRNRIRRDLLNFDDDEGTAVDNSNNNSRSNSSNNAINNSNNSVNVNDDDDDETEENTDSDNISIVGNDDRLSNEDYEDIIYDNAKKLTRFRLDEIIDKRLIPVGWPDHEFNRIYNLYDVHMKLFNWCKSLYQHGPFSRNKPLYQYSYETNNDVKIIVDRLNKAIDELCIASNYILRNNPFVVLHPKERLNVVKLENKRIRKIQKETKDHTQPFNEEDDKDIYDNNDYEANASVSSSSVNRVVAHQSIQPYSQQQQQNNNEDSNNDDEEDDDDLPDDPYENQPLIDRSIHSQTIQVYCSVAINKIRIFINKLMKTKFWYITAQQERTAFSIAVLIYNCVTELFFISKYKIPSLRDGNIYPEPPDYDKRNIMGLPSSASNGYRMNYIATIQKILESNNIKEGQRDTNHYADAIMFYMNRLAQKKKYISSFPPLLPVEEALSADYNGRYQVTNPNRGNVNVNFRNNVVQQPVVPQQQQQTQPQPSSPPSSPQQQQAQSVQDDIDNDTYRLNYDENDLPIPPPLVSSDYSNNNEIPREVSPVYSPITPPSHLSAPPGTVNHFRLDGTTRQVPYSSIFQNNDDVDSEAPTEPVTPVDSEAPNEPVTSVDNNNDTDSETDWVYDEVPFRLDSQNLKYEANSKNSINFTKSTDLKPPTFVLYRFNDEDPNTFITNKSNVRKLSLEQLLHIYAIDLFHLITYIYDVQGYMNNKFKNEKIVILKDNVSYDNFIAYVNKFNIQLPIKNSEIYPFDSLKKKSNMLRFYGYDYSINTYAECQLRFFHSNLSKAKEDLYLMCPLINIIDDEEAKNSNVLFPKRYHINWGEQPGQTEEEKKIVCATLSIIPNYYENSQDWYVLDRCQIQINNYLLDMPNDGVYKYYNYPFLCKFNDKVVVVIHRSLKKYVYIYNDIHHPEFTTEQDNVLAHTDLYGTGKRRRKHLLHNGYMYKKSKYF